MRIYYVMSDWVVDCDSSGSPMVNLFKNLEDAKKAYLEEKKSMINDSGNWSETNGWGEELNKITEATENEIDKGVANFTIYEDGRYSENHMNVELGYKEV